MNFEPDETRSHARVIPAGSVLDWWCVVSGDRILTMTPSIKEARVACQSFNCRDYCIESCAAACAGAAPELRTALHDR